MKTKEEVLGEAIGTIFVAGVRLTFYSLILWALLKYVGCLS